MATGAGGWGRLQRCLGGVSRTYREAYGGLPRAVWLLATLELVNRSGMMVLFFLTLYMTRKLGFSLLDAGSVMSAYGIGSMIGTYLGGRLSDRLGAYHVQKLSLAVSAVLLVALQLPRSPWLLGALVLVLATVQDALHPANATATAQLCTPELRAKGFALHRLAGNLGISIGPVVGGYLAQRDYVYLFWVDGLTTLAAGALAVTLLRSAGPGADVAPASGRSVRSPWRDARFLPLLPLVFGVGLVFAQIFTTFPLYLRSEYGLRESAVGGMLAVNTVLIVSVEMLLMHALRRRAPSRVVSLGTVLLGLGFALMPLGQGAGYAALTVVVWTIGEMLTMPMLMTLASERSDPAAIGAYQGLVSLAFAVASTVGPLLSTALYERAGPDSVWYACGGLGVVLAAGFAALSARPSASSTADPNHPRALAAREAAVS